jgi:hypothetical protein
MVDAHPGQPGPEGGLALEARQGPIRFDENVLGGLLGLVPIPEERQTQLIETGLMAPDQFAVEVAAPGEDPLYEFLLVDDGPPDGFPQGKYIPRGKEEREEGVWRDK